MISTKKFAVITYLAAMLGALALIAGSPVFAQDLSDNETCLECHADQPREAPADSSMPRVHNDDGSFTVEAHEMWSCVDCHDYITEIPHPEGVTEMSVNCENCHEGTPTME
jgi:hypothetical protein